MLRRKDDGRECTDDGQAEKMGICTNRHPAAAAASIISLHLVPLHPKLRFASVGIVWLGLESPLLGLACLTYHTMVRSYSPLVYRSDIVCCD